MKEIIYNFIKTWFPDVFWKIYREGEISAQKVEYKRHRFIPISEYKTYKFHLPVYKTKVTPNSQPPAMVH